MICEHCKKGGDTLTAAHDLAPNSREQKDQVNRSKAFHAKCKDAGCLCQHSTTLGLILK